jgi:hypothetical protein
MDPSPALVVALNEQTVPSVGSFPPSLTSTQVSLATHGAAPAEVDPRSSSPSLRVRGCRSARVPRESLDAPNDLTEEASCQVAFSRFKDEVPRMPGQALAGLEEPVLQAPQGPARGRTSRRRKLPRLHQFDDPLPERRYGGRLPAIVDS